MLPCRIGVNFVVVVVAVCLFVFCVSQASGSKRESRDSRLPPLP